MEKHLLKALLLFSKHTAPSEGIVPSLVIILASLSLLAIATTYLREICKGKQEFEVAIP
jgi:hypothetical protein